MPDPDEVAAGNPDVFAPHDGVPVRASLPDVDLWRLRGVQVGIVAPTTDEEVARVVPGQPLPPGVAAEELTRALLLELVDASADPRDGDEATNVCIAFELPDLELLIAEIGAALQPRVRYAIGMALVESSQRGRRR